MISQKRRPSTEIRLIIVKLLYQPWKMFNLTRLSFYLNAGNTYYSRLTGTVRKRAPAHISGFAQSGRKVSFLFLLLKKLTELALLIFDKNIQMWAQPYLGSIDANHRRGKEGLKKKSVCNTKTPFSQLSHTMSHI